MHLRSGRAAALPLLAARKRARPISCLPHQPDRAVYPGSCSFEQATALHHAPLPPPRRAVLGYFNARYGADPQPRVHLWSERPEGFSG